MTLLLTITASTPRPVQLRFGQVPSADDLLRAIDAQISADDYFDDVNGLPAYRRHDPLFCPTDPRGTRAARHLK